MEVDKELVEFIIHTAETTENYTKENMIEDLKLLVKGDKEDE